MAQLRADFNPTLVQLELSTTYQAHSTTTYFNPTLVQLELWGVI